MIARRLIGCSFAVARWVGGVVVLAEGDAVAGGALILGGAWLGVACLFRRDRGSRIFETIADFFTSLP